MTLPFQNIVLARPHSYVLFLIHSWLHSYNRLPELQWYCIFPRILPAGTINFRVCQDAGTKQGWIQLISAHLCTHNFMPPTLSRDKSTYSFLLYSRQIVDNVFSMQVSLQVQALLEQLRGWTLSHLNIWEHLRTGLILFNQRRIKSKENSWKYGSQKINFRGHAWVFNLASIHDCHVNLPIMHI